MIILLSFYALYYVYIDSIDFFFVANLLIQLINMCFLNINIDMVDPIEVWCVPIVV